MTTLLVRQTVAVCPLDDLLPGRGVAALVDGEQVALFRVGDDVLAVSNQDPFSGANVMSRGIVGSRGDRVKVASPMYKQQFDLYTGECFDDPSKSLRVYETQIVDGIVEVVCG